MKWNGRTYRPVNAQIIKKKEFNFEEALKAYGEKEMPVWNPVIGVNNSTAVPVSPTPTPSHTNTPTPTQTPSNTPTPTPTITPSPSEPIGYKLQTENSDFIQTENGDDINIEH